ncbi:MAG: hypothetical protein U0M88_00150 [Faecalicoccus sp.]|jgi:hypothetical protein|uniref:hypothetical protein n=1 Tax=Faecalicoccus sp. TaxID=1971758 RepID=UPI002F91C1A7
MKNKYYVQTVLYELVHGYYFEVSGQQVIKKETNDLQQALKKFKIESEKFRNRLVAISLCERNESEDIEIKVFSTLDDKISIMIDGDEERRIIQGEE